MCCANYLQKSSILPIYAHPALPSAARKPPSTSFALTTPLGVPHEWPPSVFVRDGLFPLVRCHQGSSMLQHVSEFPSFPKRRDTALCVHASFCLPVHLSVSAWVATGNSASVNTDVQASLSPCFQSFGIYT